MDLPTFTSIVLTSTFAIAGAVAIYAMSIGKVDPQLAKRASWVAFSSLVLFFIMFGIVGEMTRGPRYILVGLLTGCATVALTAALDHIKDRTSSDNHSEKTETKLTRPMALQNADLTIESHDGQTALLGWSGFMLNLGDAAVKIKMDDAELYLDNVLAFKVTLEQHVFANPRQNYTMMVKGDAPRTLSIGHHVVILDLTISYDTLPAVGLRHSFMKMQFDLEVTASGALVSNKATIDQKEY